MQFFTLLTVNVCKIRQKENGKTKIGANVSSMQSSVIHKIKLCHLRIPGWYLIPCKFVSKLFFAMQDNKQTIILET